MHAVDIDSANIASQAALAREAARKQGYELIGVRTSELRPGDRLVDRDGESWSGLPVVRYTMPAFTLGTWQIDLHGHRSVRTSLTRLSVWRRPEAPTLVTS